MSSSSITIFRSALLDVPGVIHGWPERHGGVSTGARSSLNMGVKWGDSRENVDENRRRAAVAAGYDPARLKVIRHNHGVTVHPWNQGQDTEATLPDEFDGHVSNRVGDVLATFAADCIPMLLVDPVHRAVGAVHAGWRGTVGEVAVNTIATMRSRFGSVASDVRVALGPSIGPCCFEVGDEVVAAFRARFGDAPGLVVDGPKKRHIDLRVASRVQLERAGVRPEHLDDTPPCTRCHPERFFSYRRDAQAGGVHLGYVGLVAS